MHAYILIHTHIYRYRYIHAYRYLFIYLSAYLPVYTISRMCAMPVFVYTHTLSLSLSRSLSLSLSLSLLAHAERCCFISAYVFPCDPPLNVTRRIPAQEVHCKGFRLQRCLRFKLLGSSNSNDPDLRGLREQAYMAYG